MLSRESLPQKPHIYNGLTLAYMGDAVFETYVRYHLLSLGLTKVNRLHQTAKKYVSAKAQADILKSLLEEGQLTEQEQAIVQRGRNANSGTIPKHTDVATYRLSTAFESLIGYLFLSEEEERLEQIIRKSFHTIEGSEGAKK